MFSNTQVPNLAGCPIKVIQNLLIAGAIIALDAQ